ncbi:MULTISPECIES: SO2930 family diheme c-type cytochrome [Myxococcaceae]|uniref:SO2930 family diheme c-type cytochrome n=1 Tax=Myxococcaceae TaxID=31 RepID=UPI001E62F63E|nr:MULTISPECIES: SO2930 family diheme c-type cytochrome [Myxococcaceae]
MRACSALLLLLALLGCSAGDAPSDPEQPACDGPAAGYLQTPPPKLSAWCLVRNDGGVLQPLGRSVPYELNTPLFSDYAQKYRTVWVPPGTRAAYRDAGPMDLPVGSVVTKTFSFAQDLRAPAAQQRRVETRILMRTEAGWVGLPYLWNAEGTDATLEPAGAIVDVAWTDAAGAPQRTQYLVPNQTQCKKCHEDAAGQPMHLLGPTAGQLNRTLDYGQGAENQLAHWTQVGLLEGAPAPEAAPRLAAWDAPGESVEARARAYLQANCAHCHSPSGPARTSGLYLTVDETDPLHLGICKPPVAAGAGSGGHDFDVVPGKPEESILSYRLRSVDPKVAMPELGRSVVHAEGVQLVEAWIRGLPGSCR